MIFRYLGKGGWALIAVLACLIMGQAYLDISIPGYMNDMTDAIQEQVVSGDTSNSAVTGNGIKMVSAALLSLILAVLSSTVAARIGASLGSTLRRLEFAKVQSFSEEDMNTFSAASLATRSTNDVYQLMQFTARGLTLIIKAPITAAFAIVMISGKHWEWTAATAAAVAVLICVTVFTTYFIVPRFKRIQWLTDGVNRAAREELEGLRTIRAYGTEAVQREKLDRASDELLDNNLSVVHAMAPMHPIFSSVSNFLTLAIYWIGAGIIASSSGTAAKMSEFSDMVVFTSYASQIISAFMMMNGVVRMFPRAMVASRRVEEVINHEPSVKDGPRESGEPGKEGTVEFRHVSFAYPGSEAAALSDVSFSVGKGETIAFIGPTGSGKSSIARLIPRLYDPDSGQVLVDGTDVREFRQTALHSRIGYVPQDAVIFTGTIRENVGYGGNSGNRSEAEIREALDIAQATEFVSSSPDGLDTRISQYGRNISGGQKQRVCIARAVCMRPEIYVFDDSFSALDFKTDLALRESLRKSTEGATRIIIAQRVGTIMDADRIAVVDGGRIVGLGTHDQLMQSCPIYRSIAESQLAGGS